MNKRLFASLFAFVAATAWAGPEQDVQKAASAFQEQEVKEKPILKFNDGLSPVSKDGLWGYINPKGEMVIPFQYKYADHFSEGLAQVRDQSDVSFIRTDGSTAFMLVGGMRPSWNSNFVGGRVIIVGSNGNMGFLTKTGQIAVPFEYEYVKPFENGRAAVRKVSKSKTSYFLIDPHGAILSTLNVDEAIEYGVIHAPNATDWRLAIERHKDCGPSCKFKVRK